MFIKVSSMIIGGLVLFLCVERNEAFWKNVVQFASNPTISDAGVELPTFPSRTEHSLSLPLISSKRVRRVIFELDSTKASGPDSIPVTVLRNCAPELSSIFSKIFNLCLKTCTFPTCWKQALLANGKH